MKKCFVVITLILAFQLARSQNFPAKFGIELGAGYNQLFWNGSGVLTIGGIPHDRTHFSATPEIRINYITDLTELLAVRPFIGYNRYGGATDEDAYWFDAVEFGSSLLYRISNCSIGAGAKLALPLAVRYYHPLGTLYDKDRSDWFSKWTAHLGVRTAYTIPPFTLGAEAWLGLNNLAGHGWSTSTIHQNHYTVLVGYTL